MLDIRLNSFTVNQKVVRATHRVFFFLDVARRRLSTNGIGALFDDGCCFSTPWFERFNATTLVVFQNRGLLQNDGQGCGSGYKRSKKQTISVLSFLFSYY